MLELIACRQCGAPAEITQRFRLDSTDGPIQHLQTICVSKHWLTPRAETVHQQRPAPDHSFAALPSCPAPAPPAAPASTAGKRDSRGLG